MTQQPRRARLWWTVVVVYTVVLFAVQSRLGFLVDALKERWGLQVFEAIMLGASLAAGLGLAALAWRVWQRADSGDRWILVGVMAGYAVGSAILEVPQERLHYVEYGLLAGLIYCAGRAQGLSTGTAGIAALVGTSGLGYVDEVLQGALWERRYFDWNDVRLNVQAATLGTLAAIPIERALFRNRDRADQP
ncbi:MAG: hypothetical protein GKS06_01525 [Acidobacteria bacterium]|nr:hypothetical protein [Acidobacteriota bacterium]